jgi:hypothetical protein
MAVVSDWRITLKLTSLNDDMPIHTWWHPSLARIIPNQFQFITLPAIALVPPS